jgi:hypothetical protein
MKQESGRSIYLYSYAAKLAVHGCEFEGTKKEEIGIQFIQDSELEVGDSNRFEMKLREMRFDI